MSLTVKNFSWSPWVFKSLKDTWGKLTMLTKKLQIVKKNTVNLKLIQWARLVTSWSSPWYLPCLLWRNHGIFLEIYVNKCITRSGVQAARWNGRGAGAEVGAAQACPPSSQAVTKTPSLHLWVSFLWIRMHHPHRRVRDANKWERRN